METGETLRADADECKVLAAGTVHGHRIELHERGDGSFVIVRDGRKQAVYALGACNLESCIKSFMGFLRSCAESTDPS